MQQRVQAILDTPTEDEKTPDDEIKPVKDQQDTASIKEPTTEDSVEVPKSKTTP
ncbi:MAG: hypothetical protein WA902_12250 [Thermosynechococcaceae cyanobacterium]